MLEDGAENKFLALLGYHSRKSVIPASLSFPRKRESFS